ncbi:MAG TPA: hypothetical protein DCZ43_09755 [candidate division Zixibacteria bacterium]|nr:hypothetical protein [candidate division Zixibacteria bacterium]
MKQIIDLKTHSIVAVACFVVSLIAISSATEFVPVFHPSISIQRIHGTIQIDGNLDDSGWNGAAKASNFVERYPGKNVEPSVTTEAFITYDNNNLYVAFVCYDDPSKIRATMCQRDQFDGNDDVCLLLDTYCNASWAYEFFVNPYGIQMDRIWSNITGEDIGFDLIWQSAAKITDLGYQVEMAIPFASLRFPQSNSQTWKVDFWRNHPREFVKQYSWAAYNQDDQCWVCQWGTADGINGVKPGRGFEILPSVIANQTGNIGEPANMSSPFLNGHTKTAFSLGGKYSVSSNITMEGTYNPDFSQIETDAAQIDVNSTIALRYPERRPFFQEGSDIFQTPFNSFYSRTINDPQYAAKLTGRSGRYNFGFLSAYDENTPYIIPLRERSILVNTKTSTVNVARASKTFGRNNFLGLILTDRRLDNGGYGTILAADGVLRLSEKYSIVTQYIISLTKEPSDTVLNGREGLNGQYFDNTNHTVALDGESYPGQALVSQLRRETRNWSFTLNYDHTSPTYRTETGYDPWNDYKNLNFYTEFDMYPSNSIFGRISPQLFTENRWDWDGTRKWSFNGGQIENNFTFAQAYANVSWRYGLEKDWGVEFRDLWYTEFHTGAQFNSQIGWSVDLGYGHTVARWVLKKGNETYLGTALAIKPIDRLTIEPSLEYSRSKEVHTEMELYKQAIARTRVRLQVNRQLSMRLVGEYIDQSDPFNGRMKSWEFDPLVTYRISSFSVFYAGSTHNMANLPDDTGTREGWRQTSRQLFMKLQYLFRV